MDISEQQLKEALPINLRSAVSSDLLNRLNNSIRDPIHAESIKKNFISYTGILFNSKYSIEEYLNAVTYVSYKLMGYTNKESYFKTFPDRQATLMAQGKSEKEISSYVAAFNKTKLVNSILEQTLVPTWVLNQDVYQQAINTQLELMLHAKSERVKAMAADSILNHLKKPENTAPLINIDLRESSGLDELKKSIIDLAKTQKELIASGVDTKQILAQKLFDKSKVEDVN